MELDLAEGFNQLRISKALQQIFTFTCSKGKVSLKVLAFGVFWATAIFQSSMVDVFSNLTRSQRKMFISANQDSNLGIRRLS